MRYIEIEVKETKKISIEEVINDGIKFFNLIGFIDICHEYDLNSGPDESIDAYNKTVIKLDELADKYGLHDYYERNNNVWYELYYLWPKMEDFFEKIIFCKK